MPDPTELAQLLALWAKQRAPRDATQTPATRERTPVRLPANTASWQPRDESVSAETVRRLAERTTEQAALGVTPLGVGVNAARLASPVLGLAEGARDAATDVEGGHYGRAGLTAILAAAPFVGPAAKSLGRAAVAGEDVARAANPFGHLPEPPRAYHGSSAAFEEFDPVRLDKEALYGPGYYFTDSPAIAGGTVREHVTPGGTFADDAAARAHIQQQRAEWGDFTDYDVRPTTAGHEVREISRSMEGGYATKGNGSAANVRPARLAVEHPFDLDKRMSVREGVPILERLGLGKTSLAADWRSDLDYGGTVDGFGIYEELVKEHGSKEAANLVLHLGGYDGITHVGGAITGSAPHKVTIAFDRGQIRSPWGDWKQAGQVGAIGALLAEYGATRRKEQDKP